MQPLLGRIASSYYQCQRSFALLGWVVQATVIYPTGTRLAWATALAFVGGSFGAIIPVVVLTAQIARETSARRWPECLMLSVSLLALVPGVLVLTALAFRR
jgi:hypothetical protein